MSRVRVDPDLGRLHARRQYDRQTDALRANVPWYRNSFEAADAPLTVELPPEPLAPDPPLQIPSDLRPLGHKTRYLRTIQLMEDPLPTKPTKDPRPFEQTLRGGDDAVSSITIHKRMPPSLSRTVSFPAIHAGQHPVPNRSLKTKVSDNNEEDDELQEPTHKSPRPLRRGTALGTTKSTGRLSPLVHRSVEPSGGQPTRRSEREQSRRVSMEEAADLSNSDCYFGPTAKARFYDQYRQLYAKPYLYMEDPALVSPRTVRDEDGYLAIPASTQSKLVPAYPSASYLKGVERDLSLAGSGVEFSDCRLPSQDKLSPRSQFLSASITRPHLASPFMLRAAMTKVYDFSFQSLGDECIIEFARCLENELPFVEEINVRDNRLSDDGLDALLRAIARGSTMLHLHRLDISENMIGPKSALTLRSFIVTPYCTLKSLLMDHADIDDYECAAFMTAFEKNLSIRELWMSHNGIGKSEHLNVVQPDFVTGGEAIASMLHSNLVLVHLDLSWNYLRLESSITLAKSMFENHTLVHLNVSYNACGDPGAMMFGEALRENQCLEILNLAYNNIGCKGAQVLANALYVNRTLRSLILDGNCIGIEGGQQLMFALCENKNALGCDISLHACSLSTSVGQAASVPLPVKPVPEALTSSSSSSETVFTAGIPTYGAKSTCVFSAKEPTGRYTLDLLDPYDRMMATELVRLAAVKKGCRFVRLEHRAAPGAPKKAVQLVRKERKATATSSVPKALQRQDSSVSTSDDPLERLGLDALFADVDRDHSGAIDQKEVMSVLNRIGLFPRTEDLAIVLKKYDFNLSGAIDEGHEFSAFFFHAVFQLLDSDQSGKIDADEVEEAYKMLGISDYDEKEILEAIAIYDITGDGEMEESEFVAFMKDKLLDRIKLQLVGASAGSPTGDDEPFVMLLDASTQKPWRVPDDGILEVDFLYEREGFTSTDEAHRLAKIPQASIEKLIRNITELADSKSEQEELYHVAIHDSDLKFAASQAYQLLDACGLLKPVERKIESVAHILPQMLTTKDAQILVSRTLTLRQRCRLKAEMGSAYSVLMGNPTAHYSLDLSKPKDRAALAKIAEVAQSEKLFSKHKSGRADTSQHGNWENFRNEELDGDKIVLSTSFFHVMPRRGKLSFDYVSTARPKKGTAPLSDRRFQQLITELQTNINGLDSDQEGESADAQLAVHTEDDRLSKVAAVIGQPRANALSKLASTRNNPLAKMGSKQTQFWDRTRNSVLQKAAYQFALVSQQATFRFTNRNTTKETVALKLVQIESTVCDRWLSSEQAAQIVACMPPQFLARPETARILFSRLIDVDNFYEIFDALDPDDQVVCAKSLGWLNIINPMAPERKYSFDLSICDEREMTKILVQLAIAEPGENWINQSFTMVKGEPGLPGWKLPVRWEKEGPKDGGGVNHSGFLELEYYSREDRGCAPLPAFRKTLMSSVLAGTKLYWKRRWNPGTTLTLNRRDCGTHLNCRSRELFWASTMEKEDERLEGSGHEEENQAQAPNPSPDNAALRTSRSASAAGYLTTDVIISRLGIYDLMTTKELILRNENLVAIDDACAQSLMALEVLSLSHNKLTTLDGFQFLTNLIELNVNFNQITSLEPLQCFEIEKLFLSNNRIVDISPLKQFPKLSTLCVYGNLISDLDVALSTCRALPKLRSLDLGGNPCAQEADSYKFQVVRSLPRLKTLDGDQLTQLDKDLADEFVLQGRPSTSDSSRPSTATTIGARPLTAKPWEADAPLTPSKPAFDPFTSKHMPKGNVRLFRDDFLNNNPILLEYLAQETQDPARQQDTSPATDLTNSSFVEKMRTANPLENGSVDMDDDEAEPSMRPSTARPSTAGLSTGIGAVLTTNLGIDPSDPKSTIRKLLKHIELLEESLASYKTRQVEASEIALMEENRRLQTENNNIPILQDEIASLKKQLSAASGPRPPATPSSIGSSLGPDAKRVNALEQENEQLRRNVQRLTQLLKTHEVGATEPTSSTQPDVQSSNGVETTKTDPPKRLGDSLLLEESAALDVELTELILQNEVSLELIRNDIKNTKKEWETQFQVAKEREQARQRVRPQTSLGLLSASSQDTLSELVDVRKGYQSVGKASSATAAPKIRSRQVRTSAGFRHGGGPEERLLQGHASTSSTNNGRSGSVTNILTL